MLSKVVSGEQLHSGPFCAGWDEEGISRMETQTIQESCLKGAGRAEGAEKISASTAVLGPQKQTSL